MRKTRKMVFLSLLVSQALVLHIVESMIPIPFITPGAKLGLANIVTVVSLYSFGEIETLLVIIVRLLLASMFGGSISSLLYSIAGALFSFFIMVIIKRIGKDKVTLIGVSAAGSVFHNIGQITMAALVVQNVNISLYLPVLTIAGIGTGFFVGLTSRYTLNHLNRLNATTKLFDDKG
ncbi:Gx transporter family protein [Clostridium folliculivorans]|uniref:Heptaprenyl diphosphate synthase subunit I n=1 Tax=Clostridium folliculivorans TaxID=2886038 RepID=A0A9W5Y5B4_9CLOT|nr:Gx transporter family protein [Clostridium folliculivorans]GKU26994.1 heptaprenyl diphosphate synthase subunit I [Clostridium folliculivorans]GKU29164.1 heptaprenyl diphosphate synthase subunit I [Clostridium folliculivorans]